jgi:acetyltransferase
VTTLHARHRAPVLTCWLGDGAAAEARLLFAGKKIPSYDTPEQGIQAFGHLCRYRRNQQLLMETPPDVSNLISIDKAKGDAIIDGALEDGRTVLTEPEATGILSAYGIPTVASIIARDAQEAATAAEELGFPVVLKILSRDISHKSDVGGVRLNLNSADAVLQAAADMLAAVRRAAGDARIDGFNVQRMIRRRDAHELIAGVAEDSVFGPVILFGEGGTAVEVIGDRSVGLPPLNPLLANEMIRATRISRLLSGYRDRPAADRDTIALTLVKLSHLVTTLERVVELDINPLLADAAGVTALDARIVVRRCGRDQQPLAIRPYPQQLEHEIEIRNGQRLRLRPIRPEDEAELVDMLRRSSKEDVRMRFFGTLKDFDHPFAARLTQIDYDREMAFVALRADSPEILGAVRLNADPDREKAEYSIMVRTDMKGTGLGYSLMSEILGYARDAGIGSVFGDVLRTNERMLRMAREFGFTVQPPEEGSDTVTVDMSLATPAGDAASPDARSPRRQHE